jgi:hypothetical protein
MTARTELLHDLALAHDGPIPPAELASARWGRGAFTRLARAADAAGAEARLRAALDALRRGAKRSMFVVTLRRLERLVADCRRQALAAI